MLQHLTCLPCLPSVLYPCPVLLHLNHHTLCSQTPPQYLLPIASLPKCSFMASCHVSSFRQLHQCPYPVPAPSSWTLHPSPCKGMLLNFMPYRSRTFLPPAICSPARVSQEGLGSPKYRLATSPNSALSKYASHAGQATTHTVLKESRLSHALRRISAGGRARI